MSFSCIFVVIKNFATEDSFIEFRDHPEKDKTKNFLIKVS